MNKRYLNKLYTFQLKDRTGIHEGIVLSFSEDWTLMKFIGDGYILDGYFIFRNDCVVKYKRDAKERFSEKVIFHKWQYKNEMKSFPLRNIETILNEISEKYGCFAFNMKSQKSSWLGNIKRITDKTLTLNYLDPKAKWSKIMTFQLGNIRTIWFDDDYTNSLYNYSKKKKLQKS